MAINKTWRDIRFVSESDGFNDQSTDLLDTKVGIIEGDLEMDRVVGEISFNKLVFSYPEREKVLDGLELIIPAGRRWD